MDYTAEDRRELLAATLESEGWRWVMLPQLVEDLDRLRGLLEMAAPGDVAMIAGLQAEIRRLKAMTENPREYFRPEDEEN